MKKYDFLTGNIYEVDFLTRCLFKHMVKWDIKRKKVVKMARPNQICHIELTLK
jgi:hypothetical protein